MYCITDQQIEYMLNDISARGVKLESLQQNLLDHICCIIEQNLEENGDFERCYHATVQTFYKKELGEIEAETNLLLTFKNYYEMRKTLLITGGVSAAVFAIGSFLKIMHWPGSALMLLTGFLLISLIFLPLLLILKARESASLRDKLVLATGIAVGILYCFSMLFMAEHWVQAKTIWLTTLTLTAFLFIPAYFFSGIRKEETKMNTIVTTVLMVAVTGIQFTLTSIRQPQPVHAYLQSQQLLQQMQNASETSNTQDNKLASDIQQTCKQLKNLIWKQATDQQNFPQDINNADFVFGEHDLGTDFTPDNDGYKLFNKLKEQVSTYNSGHAASPIPIGYTLLAKDINFLSRSSNLTALTDVIMIQLSTVNAERETLVSMK
ncbi:GldL-related protein [Chitinophagaceae bacterium MMS25-I14]